MSSRLRKSAHNEIRRFAFCECGLRFRGCFAALRIREKSRVARLLIEMANMMESMLSFGSEDSVKIIRTLSNEKAFAELTF